MRDGSAAGRPRATACERIAHRGSAGCDQMQGWLYYKAVPAAEVTRLLARPSTLGDERHGHVANA